MTGIPIIRPIIPAVGSLGQRTVTSLWHDELYDCGILSEKLTQMNT